MNGDEVYVYMDVDGVINAVNWKQPSWGWTKVDPAVNIDGFSVLAAPELVERINALAERPNVHMHWLTTWEHEAATRLSPEIGLNGTEWPVVGHEEHYSRELECGWWKLQAIRDHLPEDVRAIWIDDDINGDREAKEWLAEHPEVTPVCPRPELGLTPKQMRYIESAAA